MKTITHLIPLSLLFMFNCANAQWTSDTSTDSIADGQATLNNIQLRYRDTRQDCGSPNRPSFLCRGVILRVTKKSNTYKVWDPSPISVSRGSISFSFLSADAKFANFAWNNNDANGYIVYPNLQAPPGKIALDVLCSFPEDSWDWHRDVPCGSITLEDGKYLQVSRLCSLQGVTTAEQWLQHWQHDRIQYPNAYLTQCGFDVNKTVQGGSIAFMESIKAKNLLGSFSTWNELQVATWAQNIPTTLPIEAFFYTSLASLADARANQQEFYTATGIIVPVLSLKLPTSQQEDVAFGFSPTDQAVTGPSAPITPITTPPTILLPTEGSSISSPFDITGKSAPNATVEVFTAGGAYLLGNPTADKNGNWVIPGVMMTNYIPITARQSLNGQQSPWANNRNFSLNTSTCSSYISSASCSYALTLAQIKMSGRFRSFPPLAVDKLGQIKPTQLIKNSLRNIPTTLNGKTMTAAACVANLSAISSLPRKKRSGILSRSGRMCLSKLLSRHAAIPLEINPTKVKATHQD